MTWSAPDGGIENYDMDAFFLSTWNKTNQETSRIDLWIKKMPIDQMHVFTHQTLVGIKESYFKATEDKSGSTVFVWEGPPDDGRLGYLPAGIGRSPA